MLAAPTQMKTQETVGGVAKEKVPVHAVFLTANSFEYQFIYLAVLNFFTMWFSE